MARDARRERTSERAEQPRGVEAPLLSSLLALGCCSHVTSYHSTKWKPCGPAQGKSQQYEIKSEKKKTERKKERRKEKKEEIALGS